MTIMRFVPGSTVLRRKRGILFYLMYTVRFPVRDSLTGSPGLEDASVNAVRETVRADELGSDLSLPQLDQALFVYLIELVVVRDRSFQYAFKVGKVLFVDDYVDAFVERLHIVVCN